MNFWEELREESTVKKAVDTLLADERKKLEDWAVDLGKREKQVIKDELKLHKKKLELAYQLKEMCLKLQARYDELVGQLKVRIIQFYADADKRRSHDKEAFLREEFRLKELCAKHKQKYQEDTEKLGVMLKEVRGCRCIKLLREYEGTLLNYERASENENRVHASNASNFEKLQATRKRSASAWWSVEFRKNWLSG